MDKGTKRKFLKQTINMLLEIFGFCEIFEKDLSLVDTKIKRCNWELLPPGIKTSIIYQKKLNKNDNKRKDFNQHRLDVLDSFKPLETYEGILGFTGYYAYIFNNTCYLENGYYGNATYVIPKLNWKELSKLSKRELLESKSVIDKIHHTEDWENKIRLSFSRTENK